MSILTTESRRDDAAGTEVIALQYFCGLRSNLILFSIRDVHLTRCELQEATPTSDQPVSRLSDRALIEPLKSRIASIDDDITSAINKGLHPSLVGDLAVVQSLLREAIAVLKAHKTKPLGRSAKSHT